MNIEHQTRGLRRGWLFEAGGQWGWVLVGLCLVGCRSPEAHPERLTAGSASVDELHLLSMPIGLNLDGKPGADGFAVKVYAVSRAKPKPVAVEAGALELVIYDGVIKGTISDAIRPLRVWSFPAAVLSKNLVETAVGSSYAFTLRWGEAQPTGPKITVEARYISSEGTVIHSGSSVISVVTR